MSIPPSAHDPARSRVLIAGGGVAGLETLFARHALAADRCDVACGSGLDAAATGVDARPAIAFAHERQSRPLAGGVSLLL